MKFVLGIGNWFLAGFTLQKLYEWFVQTQFSLPHVGLYQAMGIALLGSVLSGVATRFVYTDIVNMITMTESKDEESKALHNKVIWAYHVAVTFSLALILFFGWLIS